MGQIWSTCTPTTLLDKIFKHCGPLNMKSTGNSKNIGLHYPFDSNGGPHHQNAKFSPIPCRNFGPHFDLKFCGSLWFFTMKSTGNSTSTERHFYGLRWYYSLLDIMKLLILKLAY